MNISSGASDSKQKYVKLIMTGKIFFFVFLAFTVLFILVYSLLDKEDTLKPDEIKYIESWTVTDSTGKSFEAGRHFHDNKRYDGDFTIESRLPENILDNEVLCFIANIEVTVYIGGEVREDINIYDNDMLPGGHVKTFYAVIPLEKTDAGAEIKMVRSTPSSSPEVVPETFVTTLNGVYNFLFDRYGFTFCLSMIMFVFALVVSVIAVFMQIWFRQKIDMLYGAMGILVVAAWLVTDSYLYPFVFGHYHVDGVANYMFCLLIPFGFVVYLNSVQQGRYSRYMAWILILSSINAVIWTVLNFTGILPFVDALLYIDIIAGILVIMAVILLFIDIRRKKVFSYKYTAIGILGFLFCCAVELVCLIFTSFHYEEFPMLLGLGFLLTFVVIQQVYDLRKISVEKQKAIDLSDAKTRFLASMSHEIRTPINSILGLNEIILKENRDEAIDGYSKIIRSSGKMLLTLVNDVLDFSKIEAGKLEIVEAEYSLSRVFSDLIPMFQEMAVDKALSFKILVKGSVPDGQIGDESRLKQILINLVSNAVKYTDKGGVQVTVSGNKDLPIPEGDEYEMVISVKDTGRGIRKEDINNLFDAFSRIDLKKNSGIEGTGLGLAIVKSILDSMGGTVKVESEYGKGSDFTVYIPVKVFDAMPVKEDFSGIIENNMEKFQCDYTSDAVILAVDDNSSNLTIVKLFLKETGMKPELCSDGTTAIDLCKTNRYDLILMDHMMPSPDGIETLKAIREDPESLNKDTPAVVLTANAVAGIRQMYLDSGFVDYLTKPIDSRRLINTIKKYLPKDKVCQKGIGPEEPGISTRNVKKNSFADIMKANVAGFVYEKAMKHCGGDESLLKEIMNDVVMNHKALSEKMIGFVTEKKYDRYCIEAHSLKSLMATIGIEGLSERAKKHESAVKENNLEYVEKDYEDFIKEYAETCLSILKGLRESEVV